MDFRQVNLPDTGIYHYESKHKKGEYIEAHHHNVFQILYVLDGSGCLWLDEESYQLSQHRMAFIAPYFNHSIKALSKMTVLVLSFAKESLQGFMHHDQKAFSRLLEKSYFLDLSPFVASEIKLLLKKMLHEQQRQDSFSNMAIQTYLMNILLLLERSRSERRFADANVLRAERMKDYLETHYFEPITSEDLSHMFGISSRYANDIFKERFKLTPLQFLNEVRIERTKHLLIDTDKDIVTICFEVGYETIPTFYRSFKNAVGLAPHKYRETYRETG